MEKRKFKWRYIVMSLPIAFFFSFVDQGGNFYPAQIHAAGILLLGLLMGLKKKEEMFILGNAFSTMLFVFGMINLYAMPGTNTTTSLATFPLRMLPLFSLVLLAYAVLSFSRVFYALKKKENLTEKHKAKNRVNFFLVPISYFACIGLYVLINMSIRALYPFQDGQNSLGQIYGLIGTIKMTFQSLLGWFLSPCPLFLFRFLRGFLKIYKTDLTHHDKATPSKMIEGVA